MIPADKSKIVVKSGDNDGVVLHIPFESTVIVKRRGQFMAYTMLVHGTEEPLVDKLRHLSQKAMVLFMIMAERARKGGMLTMSAFKMADCLEIQRQHVYRHLTELKGVDLIRRVRGEKDLYQMNPSYVWWGSTVEWSLAVSDWKQGVVRRVVVEVMDKERKKTP